MEGYRGRTDLEITLAFIESGDRGENGNTKSDNAKDGKRDTRGRDNGVRAREGRAGRDGRVRRPRPAAAIVEANRPKVRTDWRNHSGMDKNKYILPTRFPLLLIKRKRSNSV